MAVVVWLDPELVTRGREPMPVALRQASMLCLVRTGDHCREWSLETII